MAAPTIEALHVTETYSYLGGQAASAACIVMVGVRSPPHRTSKNVTSAIAHDHLG
jgi:hypothetical protein